MMTGKATVEMESPVAGRVVELAGEVGAMVPIGAALVVIETEGGAAEEGPAPDAPAVEERIEAETPDAGDVARVQKAEHGPAAQPDFARTSPAPAEPREARPPPPAPRPKILASPAVRQRARELGIDLTQVRAAEDGRVRHADLDAFLAYGAARGYAAAGPAGVDQQVRVVGLRRRIAEAMAASKRHIPHFSYVEECDVTDLEAVRAQLNAELGAQSDRRPRLTLLPFLIVAICRSVPAWPMVNARYDDEAGVVTRHGAVHLGLATQTRAGLMVPVIRNAQMLNLWQLAGEIARLAQAARDGSARAEELTGSTLTVTSLGALGGIASTPIVNRPEVAIVAPNRIVERPMFIPDGLGGERLAKRKLMNLSLSCDHRVIDGWDAASFVQAIKRLLEAPALLLAGPIDSPGALP
jgi:2-oxoisovalerate dehydrogenase E2 component (dihydrolipoyl transacylase)